MREHAVAILLVLMITFATLSTWNPPRIAPAKGPDEGAAESPLGTRSVVQARSSSGGVADGPTRGAEGGQPEARGAVTPSVDARHGAPTAIPLDGLQTPEETEAMIAACPSNRRIVASANEGFEAFMESVFAGLNNTVVNDRPLYNILKTFKQLRATHKALRSGFWAEFGVFRGSSLTSATDALLRPKMPDEEREQMFNGVLAGFDSFEGLPVDWREGFSAGQFGAENLYETVRASLPPEVELYKGWFQNTIGKFLAKHPKMPATHIHHDGDLFVSAAITFSMLADRIVPGTLMTFDELQGYWGFEQHEILALYIWMVQHRVELCAMAVHTPINGLLRNPPAPRFSRSKQKLKVVDSHFWLQSASFQVLRVTPVKHC